MIALAVAWIMFDFLSKIFGQGGDSIFGGSFLTPRNLFNLSVQTASVAVMATGMVLIIVSRNIDLSVGSLLGFLAMVMAMVQKEWLPDFIGFDNQFTWLIALAVGIGLGALIGAGQGFLIAFMGIPAFIVTLGGMLVWRGGAFLLASGRTIAPLDENFSRIGGGTEGSLGRLGMDLSIGSSTLSWILGIGVVLILIALLDQRPTTTPGLRLPDASDVGRSPHRCRWHGSGAWCRLGRQQLSLAGSRRTALCRGQRHRPCPRADSSSPPASPTRCSSWSRWPRS